MEKIKVAQIITRLDRGGSTDVVLLIASKLNQIGYQTTLISGFTVDPPENMEEYISRAGVKRICIHRLRREINPFNDFLALVKLYRIIRKEKFDIVHTHTSKAGLLGRMAAWLARTPIIFHHPHGHVFYGYFGSLTSKAIILMEKLSALFTDRIFTLTELGKKDHIKFKIGPAEKFLPVYCGIELSKFSDVKIDPVQKKKEFEISPHELVVGMVARLVPVKGCEYFIKACAQVKKEISNTKFMLIGDGPMKDELKRLSSQLGISESIIFTGNRNDVPELLNIFDLFVLSSLNEGLGRVLIEAQACGKPVVATNVGGIPEVVKDGQTALLVPSKNVSRLAQAVVSLLKDESRARKMGEAGRKWVDAKFSSELMMEKITQSYDEFIIKKLKKLNYP